MNAATRPRPWICGQGRALPTTPPAPQQRPTHALPMADKLTRSLQLTAEDLAHARMVNGLLAEGGLERRELSPAEIREVEPALN